VADELETALVNVVRRLAMDAVQRANSGHPVADGARPVADVLWTRVMKYDAAIRLPDRDVRALGRPRSMLLYSCCT